MRKFRFVGESGDLPYDFESGKVYQENYKTYNLGGLIKPKIWTVIQFVKLAPWCWEQVFDQKSENETYFDLLNEVLNMPTKEPKPIHKDTDLGIFSAMFVSTGMTIDGAIELAKCLIIELDKETK